MLKRAGSGPVDNWTLSLNALQSRRWLSCHISCYFCPGCVVITTPNACAVSNSELQWGSIITQSILCSIPSTENTWVTCEAGYGVFITMTSLWARLCLKSPASRLFTQPFIQGTDTKISKLRVTGEFPAQRSSNAENISIFLYVHGLIHGCLIMFISRTIRWNCFSKMWRISLSRIIQNYDLQC